MEQYEIKSHAIQIDDLLSVKFFVLNSGACQGSCVIKLNGVWVAKIEDLHVSALERKKGIATKMLEAVLTRSKSFGMTALTAVLRRNNLAGITFFTKHGFRVCVEDAEYWTMTKFLT